MSGQPQPQPVPAPADIQAQYNRYKNELQAIASKIGELESDIEEHE
jgi:prefoldin subunit 2